MSTPKERAARAFEYALSYYNMNDATPTLVEIEEAADKVLAAIAEPSEAMINGALRAWYGDEPDNRSHMRNLMRLTLKAAHAAMMAEKDTGE